MKIYKVLILLKRYLNIFYALAAFSLTFSGCTDAQVKVSALVDEIPGRLALSTPDSTLRVSPESSTNFVVAGRCDPTNHHFYVGTTADDLKDISTNELTTVSSIDIDCSDETYSLEFDKEAHKKLNALSHNI